MTGVFCQENTRFEVEIKDGDIVAMGAAGFIPTNERIHIT